MSPIYRLIPYEAAPYYMNWQQRSLSTTFNRTEADTPAARVPAESLQDGVRVRCFYYKDGRKSSATDTGVISCITGVSSQKSLLSHVCYIYESRLTLYAAAPYYTN